MFTMILATTSQIGYYQPAGPLISVPTHGHTTQQPPSLTKSAPLSEASPTSTSPAHHQQPPPAPSSNGGDSSDSEVIITSVTVGKDNLPPPQQPPATYRYAQYSGAPPGYSYSYPTHYYPSPQPPAPTYAHHDLCYPSSAYLHPKYAPATYRRYLPSAPQYYATSNPADLYAPPPPLPPQIGPSQSSQQMVSTTPVSASGSSYQTTPSGPPPPTLLEPYPPPPTLVETYPHHPSHYYSAYGPAPPPSCYTHSPPARTIPYINAAYQSCPCPMQSCPKNVLTGPLTGDSKRSNISSQIAKDTSNMMPLPPVALALPLEPASATGPPSPARGSAGMPPPPSPAGATYHQPIPPPKQEYESPEIIIRNDHNNHPIIENNKRKARIGKAMVRNNIAAAASLQQQQQNNTMLLMCNPSNQQLERHHIINSNYPNEVKREIESPKELKAKKEICSSDDETRSTNNNNNMSIVNLETEVIKDNINDKKLLLLQKKDEDKKSLDSENIGNEKKLIVVHEELLEPCISTVAENVKVKNMKRKMSADVSLSTVSNNNNKKERKDPLSEVSAAPKRMKSETKYSYKNLIKKNITTVKMNNGKRKLINEYGNLDLVKIRGVSRMPKIRFKKSKTSNNKRKLLKTTKDEDQPPSKRLKQNNNKPLAASNLHNSKQYSKNNNNRNTVTKNGKLLSENKEPTTTTATTLKRIITNNNNNNIRRKKSMNNQKKLAPAILDNLIARNSIDRTIDSVISESIIRTSPKELSALQIITNNNNNNNKCLKSSTSTVVIKESLVNKKSTNNINIINNNKNGQINNNNNNNTNNNNNNNNSSSGCKTKIECRKNGVNRRKSKCKDEKVVAQVISKIPRKSLQLPRWSNGWTWEGNSFEAKVFLNSDETTMLRKCYPAMRHQEGDIIQTRDCVLLKAGQRKNELPFVAKIAYLWENPDDGEMMMSLLWFYRPEHTEQGRLPTDQPDEVFASRHKDSNSVACIDDKCYVLTFNEYCRYRKELRRLEEGIEEIPPCIPIPEPYPRVNRQPPTSLQMSSDMVFFCRKVYDFRQKRIAKNPS